MVFQGCVCGIFVRKENLEMRWGGKGLSVDSQFPQCSRRDYIDWIPLPTSNASRLKCRPNMELLVGSL